MHGRVQACAVFGCSSSAERKGFPPSASCRRYLPSVNNRSGAHDARENPGFFGPAVVRNCSARKRDQETPSSRAFPLSKVGDEHLKAAKSSLQFLNDAFQPHEINALANRLSVSADDVRRAIAAVGNNRASVRREIIRARGSIRVPRARATMFF